MTASGAFTQGLRRVLRASWLVAGVWLSTIVLALPLAVLLQRRISENLGSSLAAQTAAESVNFDWWNEFLAQSAGIAQSFVPAVMGFAAVLKNLSSVADAQLPPFTIVMAAAAHGAVSLFLLGGVLDRLARDHPVGTRAFFAACGVFFFRFLRLGCLAALVYFVLFAWVHPWLFDTVYPAWTRNVSVERTAFAWRVVLYAVFGTVVLGINLLFDYAKIRAVVEDRRSMFGALSAGARFVARHPRATICLYLMDTGVFLLVAAAYAAVAPGAAGGTPWLAFAIGQLYIVLRVIVRLHFAASQIALFQGRLAHAGYTAARTPAWPDSPAAEIMGPDRMQLG